MSLRGVGLSFRRVPSDRGMVTAELAFGALLVACMAIVVVWIGGVVTLQQRLNDVATQVARQEARGDRDAVAKAKESAPKDSAVEVRHEQDEITVIVRCRPTSPIRWLDAPELTATARVLAEPGEP